MFKNIGKKLMILAKVMFWVMLCAFVIGGVALIVIYASYNGYYDGYYYSAPDYFLIIGIVMAAVGPILAWLSSWGIYSWGELVDNVNQIKNAGGIATVNPVDTPVPMAVSAPEFETEKNPPANVSTNPEPVVDEAAKPVDPRIQKIDMLLTKGLITQEEHDRAIANL